MGGKIKVRVTIKDGRIENVEILEQAETETLGAAALPDYVQQTIEKQDLEQIDVVTGVTVTLDGYREAVNAALAQAVM